MPISKEQFEARSRSLRMILLDVDGVLTDGTIDVSGQGDEQKSFFVRDGAAIVWAQKAGLEVGLLSGRASEATTRRANELHLTTVIQGQLDKRLAYLDLVKARAFKDDHVAYMGDDLLDLPVLLRVGLSAAPGDACEEVRQRVHYTSRAAGGRGAVREFIELILRGRGRWDGLVRAHLT
ncbi:MAG: HAD hydrolase family protein [Acidobacteria bacterium]|jgi:3-deoxy-D-manno-octulosonate 8-phosphate phosphatase (KDO 8-P phosphatase)|nr:HAD hydrolase family protein [Acidobacteriota bacterium]